MVMENGIVKWYNDAKRYGFIIAPDGEMLFCEKHNIVSHPKTLFERQKVLYERFEDADFGLAAKKITVLSKEDSLLNYDYEFKTVENENIHMSTFQGRVLLVVNTASRCGFTGQYDDLQFIYEKYKNQGLSIVAFPTNNFGAQEPGSNQEICEFVQNKYKVDFPVMEKTDVNENPIISQLAEITGVKPEWNFHKYLIDRNGNNIKSYYKNEDMQQIIKDIEELL